MLYIVRAVQERAHFVKYLQKRIPDLRVVWDQERSAYRTFVLALKAQGNEPAVQMEDDILLCENFIERVEAVIEKNPGIIISFFTMRDIHESRIEGYSPGPTNQCNYIPAEIAVGLVEASKTHDPTHIGAKGNLLPESGDAFLCKYMQKNRLKYLISVPNLCDHRRGKSAMNPSRSSFRQSKSFVRDFEVPVIDSVKEVKT